MKSLFLTTVCYLMACTFSWAQDTTYFDGNWRFVDKEDQVYFRVVQQKGEAWEFFTFYSENGQPQRKAYFSERSLAVGSLDPAERVGKWIFWHQNGQKENEVEYLNGKAYMRNSWDKKGNPMVVDGNGLHIYTSHSGIDHWEYEIKDGLQDGSYKEYWVREDGNRLRMEEHYKAGVAHGLHRGYYFNGQLRREGSYVYGVRKGEWKWWKPSGKKLDKHTYTGEAGESYEDKDVEVEAKPLNIPEVVLEIGKTRPQSMAELEGEVVVRLLVSKKGRVEKVVVLENPHPVLTRSVVEHVDEIRFTPSSISSEPIQSWITIPFNFEN